MSEQVVDFAEFRANREQTTSDREVVRISEEVGAAAVTLVRQFAEKYPEVFQVLPRENSEIMQLHRQYVANVIYTIAGDDFTDWLNRKLKQRNKKIAEERNLNIKMDPEIYRHFKASESISGK